MFHWGIFLLYLKNEFRLISFYFIETYFYIWFVISEESPNRVDVIRVYIYIKASSTSPLLKNPTKRLGLCKSLAYLQQYLLARVKFSVSSSSLIIKNELDVVSAILINYIINYNISKRDLFLGIHNFKELRSLADNAKVRSSLKFLLIRYKLIETPILPNIT